MITIGKSKYEAIQIFVTTKNQTRIVLEFCATVNGRFFELNLEKKFPFYTLTIQQSRSRSHQSESGCSCI
jgi:hypothetical protein